MKVGDEVEYVGISKIVKKVIVRVIFFSPKKYSAKNSRLLNS